MRRESVAGPALAQAAPAEGLTLTQPAMLAVLVSRVASLVRGSILAFIGWGAYYLFTAISIPAG